MDVAASVYSGQYIPPPAHSHGKSNRMSNFDSYPRPHHYHNHHPDETPYVPTNPRSLHAVPPNRHIDDKIGRLSGERNNYVPNFIGLPYYDDLSSRHVAPNRDWPPSNNLYPLHVRDQSLPRNSFPADNAYASALHSAQLDYLASMERNPTALFVAQYEAHINSLQAQLRNFVSNNLPAPSSVSPGRSFPPGNEVFPHDGNRFLPNFPPGSDVFPRDGDRLPLAFANSTGMPSCITRAGSDIYSPRSNITYPENSTYAHSLPHLYSARDSPSNNGIRLLNGDSLNTDREHFTDAASRQRFVPYSLPKTSRSSSGNSRRRRRKKQREDCAPLMTSILVGDSLPPPPLLSSANAMKTPHQSMKQPPPLKLHIITPSLTNLEEDLPVRLGTEVKDTSGNITLRPPPLLVGNRMLAKKLQEEALIDLTVSSRDNNFVVHDASTGEENNENGNALTVSLPSLSGPQDHSPRSVLDLSVNGESTNRINQRIISIDQSSAPTNHLNSGMPALIQDECRLNNYSKEITDTICTPVHGNLAVDTNNASKFYDHNGDRTDSGSLRSAPIQQGLFSCSQQRQLVPIRQEDNFLRNPRKQFSNEYSSLVGNHRRIPNKLQRIRKKPATVSRPPSDVINYRLGLADGGCGGSGTSRDIMNYDSEMCGNSGARALLNCVPSNHQSVSTSTAGNSVINDGAQKCPSTEYPHVLAFNNLHIKQEIVDENDKPTDSGYCLSTHMNANLSVPVSSEPLEVQVEEEENDENCNNGREDEQIESDIIRIQDQDGNNIVCALSADIDSYSSHFDVVSNDTFSPSSFPAPFTSPYGSEGGGKRRKKNLNKSWDGGSLTDVSLNDSLGDVSGDSGAMEFRCELCNYCGRSQNCLNKHYIAHAQPQKICEICKKAFERPSDLVRHIERHRKMGEGGECIGGREGLMSQRSPRKKGLSSSGGDRTRHTSKEDIPNDSQSSAFSCSRCTCTFNSSAALRAHSLSSHIPPAAARIDTYISGALQDTAIVSCELTDKNEISIDFVVPNSLLDKSTEIPGISTLDEVRNILESIVSVENGGTSGSFKANEELAIVSTIEECDSNISMPQLEREEDILVSTCKQPGTLLECSNLLDKTNSVDSNFKELRPIDSSNNGVHNIGPPSLSVNKVQNIVPVYIPKTEVSNVGSIDLPNSGVNNIDNRGKNCISKASEQTEVVNHKSGDAMEALKLMIRRNISPANRHNVQPKCHPTTYKIVPHVDTLVQPVIRQSVQLLDVDHPLDLSTCKNTKHGDGGVEPVQICCESTPSVSETESCSQPRNDVHSLKILTVDGSKESDTEVKIKEASGVTPVFSEAITCEPSVSSTESCTSTNPCSATVSNSSNDVHKNRLTDVTQVMTVTPVTAVTADISNGAATFDPAVTRELDNERSEIADQNSSGALLADTINTDSSLLGEILDVKPCLRVFCDVDTTHVSQKKSKLLSDVKSQLLMNSNVKSEAFTKLEVDEQCFNENGCQVFVCAGCKYTTFMRYKFVQHMKAHSGRFICKACGKACIKSSDLYRHWVTHNVKGADGHYACDSCEFTSPSKNAVEQHMKRHYILRPDLSQKISASGATSRCGICHKSVPRLRIFEHKRAMHGRWLAAGLKSRVSTSEHRDALSSTKSLNVKCEDERRKCTKKSLSCPKCELGFSTSSYLLRHYFVHHQGGDLNDLQTRGIKIENETTIQCRCRFCAVECTTVEDLHKHEVNHIMETGTNKNNNNNNNNTDSDDRCDHLSNHGDLTNVSTTATSINSSAISSKDTSSLFPAEVKSSSGNTLYLQSNPNRLKSETVNDTKVLSPPPRKSHKKGESGRPLACPHCPKSFKLKYFYEQHQLLKHGGDGTAEVTSLRSSNRNEQYSAENSLQANIGSADPGKNSRLPGSSVPGRGTALNEDDNKQTTNNGLQDNYSTAVCPFIISDVVGSDGATGCSVDDANVNFSQNCCVNPFTFVEPLVIEPQDASSSDVSFCVQENDLSVRSTEFRISVIRSLKQEI